MYYLRLSIGPFTLGGISAGYRAARYCAGIRCVYTRRETGGKTVGVMQMSNRLFTWNTISVDVIRNFARRRQRQRKQRRVWVLEALHWETERCRRIMHTCARANCTDRTTHFRIIFILCQNFTSAVCAYIISILNVTTSRKTTIKCRQSQYILLTNIYRAYEATGLHRHARQRNVNNQFIKTKALIGQEHVCQAVSRRKIAPEAIERGTARVSRRNK